MAHAAADVDEVQIAPAVMNVETVVATMSTVLHQQIVIGQIAGADPVEK